MAEDGPSNAGVAPPPAGYVIHKLYLKDLSFESPKSPEVFQGEWGPQVEINCQTAATRVSNEIYEVVLTATVTAKLADEVGFLIEVQQAGLFQIPVSEAEGLRRMLTATCPGVLYPYAREVVSDVVTRGGFPQLLLAPADFDAMFRAQQERERTGAPGAGPPAGGGGGAGLR